MQQDLHSSNSHNKSLNNVGIHQDTNTNGIGMKILRAVVSIILLVAFDQFTKYLVTTKLELNEYHPILGNVFGLYYLYNNGMAWGMFQNKQIVFVIFTLIVLVLLSIVYFKALKDTKFRPLNIVILFLMSGAIGNLIDRVFKGEFLHGSVTDFLYIKCINFPVFNVADMYVTLSIAAAILLIIFKYKEDDLEPLISISNKTAKGLQDSNETFTIKKSEGAKNSENGIIQDSNHGMNDSKQEDIKNEKSDENAIKDSIGHKLDNMFIEEEEEE